MPTLQQMRYFVAIADTLHFRRAAAAVNVTQPTLSAQLKELELRLGVQLVERSRSRVMLTPVGREIVDRARRVLRDVEEIRNTARLSQRPLGDTIKLGVVQSLGSYLLPVIVPDLHESHPDLRFYVREALADTLLDQLDTGGLDLLFFPLPLDRADLVTEPVFHEPLRVVVSQEHPLAQKDIIDPADLRGETLLTLEPGHRLYDQVRQLSEQYQADLSHDFEGTSLDTLRQMVAMGMGISLLPALYIRSEVARERLVVDRPVGGTPPSRLIGMVWRKGAARDEEFRDLAQIIAGILSARAPEVTVVAG
ncbi:MAG: LysR substrate-binding domain-containing protein [Pseudomonadota bacterium]